MAVLLASVFLVMVGYGSTLTALPDHIQRVGGLGADVGSVAFHLGLIVGLYALAGLLASPIVGRLGDRRGRRPVLLAGLAGLAGTQVLFGLGTSLWMLYLLRLLGGFADAALLVTATAYIADNTSDRERTRGMAWFGTAVSLGLVAGPAFTAPLASSNIEIGDGIVGIDGHSIPFLFSGLLAAAVLALANRHLPGSTLARPTTHLRSTRHQGGLSPMVTIAGPLLLLVFAAQYGLAIFEGVFVLYARDRLSLTPGQIALAFMACGATLAVQLPAVDWLTARMSSVTQVAVGFGIMGLSLVGLLAARSFPFVLAMAAAHGAGGAVVIPNLSALVSELTRSSAGLALGLKNSASSLGQFLGPLIGGSLMGMRVELPFLVAGALLMVIALTVPHALGSGGDRLVRLPGASVEDRRQTSSPRNDDAARFAGFDLRMEHDGVRRSIDVTRLCRYRAAGGVDAASRSCAVGIRRLPRHARAVRNHANARITIASIAWKAPATGASSPALARLVCTNVRIASTSVAPIERNPVQATRMASRSRSERPDKDQPSPAWASNSSSNAEWETGCSSPGIARNTPSPARKNSTTTTTANSVIRIR